MGFLISDVVPFTQARAKPSKLVDHDKAGAEKIISKNGKSHFAAIDADRLDDCHLVEHDQIHWLLIEDAKQGLADTEVDRIDGADAAIARVQHCAAQF